MRYVIMFNEQNQQEGMIHFKGKKLNPDEEVKRIEHPNYKRFSEQMLKDLVGNDKWEIKINFIHLDAQGEPFFNEQAYEDSLKEE